MRLLSGILLFVLLATPLFSAEEAPDDTQWTRPGPIPVGPEPVMPGVPLRSAVEIGEIATLENELTVFRPGVDGLETPERLQVGDLLLVGDKIQVGPASAVEVTMGLNARLRLGPGSVVRVLDRRKYAGTGRVESVTARDMELTKGSARIRVRENAVTPSHVLLVSGDAELLVARSDAVIERRDEAQKSTVMVLEGQAQVKMKARSALGLEVGETRTVGSQQRLEVPDGPLENVPEPTRMSRDELQQMREKLGFSVEQELKRRPPPPEFDRELDAP